MQMMEICEKIGDNLRETIEGKQIFDLRNCLYEELEDENIDLIEKTLKRAPYGLHFNRFDYAKKIFEFNRDNIYLKNNIEKILGNSLFMKLVDLTKRLYLVSEEIKQHAFSNEIKYTLTKNITISPEIIRSIQDLAVECQKTDVMQHMIINMSKPEFKTVIYEFDQIGENDLSYPYSKVARNFIYGLYNKGLDKDVVNSVYLFLSVYKSIGEIIYNSFFDKILFVKEADIIYRYKNLGNISALYINLNPNLISTIKKEQWVIKIEKKNSKFLYAQVYKKNFSFKTRNDHMRFIYKAIEYNFL